MTIEIKRNSNTLYTVNAVMSATLTDKLSGENTFDFSTLANRISDVNVGDIATLGNDIYTIVRVAKSLNNSQAICQVSCEHISYKLNDDVYKTTDFNFSGTAPEGLAQILNGTGLTAGACSDISGTYSLHISGDATRRNVLMDWVTTCGAEIDYDGYIVNMVKHRGSAVAIPLVDGKNVTSIGTTIDSRQATAAYSIELYKGTEISVGDVVSLNFEPYKLSAETRIVSMSYNPFYRRNISVEVGDYKPSILSTLYVATKNAKKAERVASQTASSLTDYAKKDDVKSEVESAAKAVASAEVKSYVNSDEGKSSIVQSLKGTYVETDDLTGYVKQTSLSTEIGSYIDTKAGTAKIVSAVSGTYQTKDAMSGYVTTTSLDASIGSYIDTQAGTAKIVSAVSGTYQTKDGMKNYATVTSVSSIEQSVSQLQSDITLSATYSNNTIGTNVQALLQLVSNANSSKITIKADKIDFTGFTTFLKASDLGSSGSTTIDGARITTGTISADRIDTDSIKLRSVYGKSALKDKAIITTDATRLYIGGDSDTSYFSNYIDVYIGATSRILFGNSTFKIVIDTKNLNFYPEWSSTNKGTLGTSSKSWGDSYFGENSSGYHIIAKNCQIYPSTNSASSDTFVLGKTNALWQNIYTKEWNVYYSENNGIKASASSSGCTLAPVGTTTTQPISSLGTATVYWYRAYLGEYSVMLGKSSTSKIGFFGTTEVAQQTVSNTATVATLITALKKYGLIK